MAILGRFCTLLTVSPKALDSPASPIGSKQDVPVFPIPGQEPIGDITRPIDPAIGVDPACLDASFQVDLRDPEIHSPEGLDSAEESRGPILHATRKGEGGETESVQRKFIHRQTVNDTRRPRFLGFSRFPSTMGFPSPGQLNQARPHHLP